MRPRQFLHYLNDFALEHVADDPVSVVNCYQVKIGGLKLVLDHLSHDLEADSDVA